MQTVAETREFNRAAKEAGLSAEDISAIISYLAEHPQAGDEIQGTGGCRKVRFAGLGKGKSGGYRVITFFSGPTIPVFLLTVFSKGDRADLSGAERNALRDFTKDIVAGYSRRATLKGQKR